MRKFFQIANPVQVRHFLFMFPPLTRRQKISSINFALKNCFPYKTEDLEVDYRDSGKKTFAFACEKSICDSLKKRNANIISVCFLFQRKFRNSLIICFFSNCLFIQKITEGKTRFIRTLRYETLDKEDLKNFIASEKNVKFFRTSDCSQKTIASMPFAENFPVECVDSLVSRRSAKSSGLFIRNYFRIKTALLIFIILAASAALHVKVYGDWQEKKAAYEQELAAVQANERSLMERAEEAEAVVRTGIPFMMERLCSLEENLRFSSFSVYGTNVHFEASVKSSEEFARKIRQESWLTDVRFENVRVTGTGEEISCSFGVLDAL